MADGPTGVPDDGLDEELRALGRSLSAEPVRADLAASVLARLQDDPAPARRPRAIEGGDPRPGFAAWWERQVARRWRLAVALLVAALLALVVGSPASARIAEWFGFGGVVVVPASPSAPPLPAVDPPEPGEVGAEISLSDARRSVPFELAVPQELGDPDSVEITADGRVVSMLWRTGGTAGGVVRLDQFAGEADPAVFKTYTGVQYMMVGTGSALWFARPHPVVYRDAAGTEHTAPPRTSGPALVWQRGPVTLRLEGVAEGDRAVDIAESAGD